MTLPGPDKSYSLPYTSYDRMYFVKSNFATISFLVIIVLAAGLFRFAGFSSPHGMTWDEEFYVQMGEDLTKNPLNYNCRYFVGVFERLNLDTPEYLHEPLFKHPPLFSYLLSFVFRTGGATYEAASLVPIFFGLVLVFLSFALGSFLFNKNTGLAAAFLAAIDPINWACSEKIWMETTLAAFMWIAVYFVIRAAIGKKYLFYYLAGAASGFAILTKYPGFLVFPIGFTIVALEDRRAFRSPHFWMWPLIAALMFLPWIIWNCLVYGGQIIAKVPALHEVKPHIVILSAAAIAAMVVIAKTIKTPRARFALALAALLFVFSRQYVMDGIAKMFNAAYVPPSGWKPGMFQSEPWTFYFRRMIELSPFYLFAFAGILFLAKKGSREKFLIIPALWSLLFFSVWGSYQSRYVLFASIALLVLAARTVLWCWEKIGEKSGSGPVKTSLRLCLAAIVLLALLRTAGIDMATVIGNDFLHF